MALMLGKRISAAAARIARCARRSALVAVILAVSPGLAFAKCPPLPDRTAERAGLLAALKASPDPAAGRTASDNLWRFWVTAPDEAAQDMLDRGMAAIQDGRFDMAEAILEDLVEYCPGFAEGWNQRAFARYLKNQFEGSLEDIERTLELEPSHFGALSGKAVILVRQGKVGLARLVLIKAVAVNPWLNERIFLQQNPGNEL